MKLSELDMSDSGLREFNLYFYSLEALYLVAGPCSDTFPSDFQPQITPMNKRLKKVHWKITRLVFNVYASAKYPNKGKQIVPIID